MALMLLHERKRSQGSLVSGYIAQLPQQFTTLLHWSEEELHLLMYPHLIQQVRQPTYRNAEKVCHLGALAHLHLASRQ